MDENASTLIPGRGKKAEEPTVSPALTLIAHPDTTRIGEVALLAPLNSGCDVHLSRVECDFKPPDGAWSRPLADPFLSREPIAFLPAGLGGVRLVRLRCKTLIEVVGQPDQRDWLFSIEQLAAGVIIVLAERIVLLLHHMRTRRQLPPEVPSLVGFSDGILFVREEITKVADLDTPVLLRGASGTGKELVARAIHDAGKRKRAFVSVNMGAVPASLAASELFGAVKGSFTGAERNQEGYFRAARGGTLFLDEIGEAPPEVQVLLLRALESGEISPVGAQKPVRIDTRLVAATDADLETKMADASFKTPLFHRLAGYEIRLPPLPERLEDFGRLFMHFARVEMEKIGMSARLKPTDPAADPWLPTDLVKRLLTFHWPGNIRQLRNMVRQLVIGCRGETCLRLVPKVEEMLADAPSSPAYEPASAHRKITGTSVQSTPETIPPEPVPASSGQEVQSQRRKPREIAEDELISALKVCRWDLQAAADHLGISRAAIYLLIDKTPGLRRATEIDAEEIRACLQTHDNDELLVADALRISIRALRRRMNRLGLR
ncbi:MAG: sigma 54-interacting transcriptional regulator [Acidobacteriota bacterium]|nr:sigma 54-interacting transcriptional regulator [Acidobacteriota bacterium]